jgi:hypothetical protein
MDQSTPYTIPLDYPLYSAPRYGWGKQPHAKLYEIISRNRTVYQQNLQQFLHYQAYYTAIQKSSLDAVQPTWINGSLPGLDAVALYGFIAATQPKKYLEVGAGHSTKFARRAIRDHNLSTTLIAIDPYPMPGIEALCDHFIQSPLEQMELTHFETLEAGDILFIDSTHCVFMNSDVTVIFLDILPRLKPGVLVEFHDITLPVDYPAQWVKKYYSEQYLLAAYLLAEGQKFDIILPNAFITLEPDLNRMIQPLWQHPDLNGDRKVDLLDKINDAFSEAPQFFDLIDTHGSSFWIKMR